MLTALHEGTEEATRPKGPAIDQNRATEIATEIATETATATVTKIATETATEAEPATATATASTGDATEPPGTKGPDATRTRPAAHAPPVQQQQPPEQRPRQRGSTIAASPKPGRN